MKKKIIMFTIILLLFMIVVGVFLFIYFDLVTVYKYSENGQYYYSLDYVEKRNIETKKVIIHKNKKGKYDVIYHKYLYYYDNKERASIYDLDNNRVILNDVFVLFNPLISSDLSIIAVRDNNMFYLYDLEKNDKLDDISYNDLAVGNGSSLLNTQSTFPELNYPKVYNTYLKVEKDNKVGIINLVDGKNVLEIKYDFVSIYNNYIFAQLDDYGYLFDYSGTPVFTNYDIKNILDDQYIVVYDQNILKILNIEGEEIAQFGEEIEYQYDSSNICDDSIAIKLFNSSDSKNVYYSYNINEKSISYIEDSSLELCFMEVVTPILKPILYLYPEDKQKISVTFDNSSVLLSTYPKYVNSWNVTAYPDGSLYDANGKYYYALYWDEKRIHSVDFSEGFYVEGDEAISFLEEKLSYIGLSDRERNEFIMYWLPVLEQNEKNLVYFELTDERNKNSKIHISPNPDSLLRVLIHIKKIDYKINIKEEKLVSFQRYGYTAVEWGGIKYN